MEYQTISLYEEPAGGKEVCNTASVVRLLETLGPMALTFSE